MDANKYFRLCFAFVVFSVLTTSNAIADQCLKKVFNKYCLGGEIVKITNARKPDGTLDDKGAGIIIYQDPKGITVINTWKGLIHIVAREYTPGTMLVFNDKLEKLSSKYREGKSESYYPHKVSSDGMRQLFIKNGEARERVRWQMEGWNVVLNYDNPSKVGLIYFHNAISEDRSKNIDEGL